ncbi:MAG: hypothetical protein AAF702_23075 [Chloroflexota bacterium]
MSNYQELAKKGAEKRKAAFQEKSTRGIFALLSDALKDFQDALDLAQDLPNNNRKKQWILAHLGATHHSMAHFYPDEDNKTFHLNKAREFLLRALNLEWTVKPLSEQANWGTVNYAWGYAHLGELFTYRALVQRREPQEEQKNYQNAIDSLSMAIKMELEEGDNYTWAISHRGLAYRQRATSFSRESGDNDRARMDFERVYELDVKKENHWNALYLGATYRALGLEVDDISHMSEEQLKEAYIYLKRSLAFFEWVADKNPELLVRMETLEPYPLHLHHLDAPLALPRERTDIMPSFMIDEHELIEESYNFYNTREELRQEFLKDGPTPEVQVKIDQYYTLLGQRYAQQKE